MFGGVQAVTWTDVKTMSLIVGGLVVMIVVAILGLPDGVSVTDGLAVAANAGKLRTFDFSFDLSNQYTFWSGTIAALFLFCSYFGADQSQVQRYLTARSLDEARRSLLMSAYWKIPLQVIVLLVGVLVFVFYTFNPGPCSTAAMRGNACNRAHRPGAYTALQSEFDAATRTAARRPGVHEGAPGG
jgi:Na+/proline symporter